MSDAQSERTWSGRVSRGIGSACVLLAAVTCGGGDEAADAPMVSIPAGTYTLGPDAANPDEAPAHEVTLDAFDIDQYEVSNSDFRAFINSEECPGPVIEGNPDPCVYDGAVQSVTRDDYWKSNQYAYFPVINVRWDQAEAYCRWLGKRLPTEAEWEAAARGTTGSLYPWGDTAPTCEMANFEECQGDTMEVGSLEAGVSSTGAFDMSGNVAEWVADYYNTSYYTWDESDNPQGPITGTDRVVRGGSWYCSPDKTSATFRDHADPLLQYNSIGFRCAR